MTHGSAGMTAAPRRSNQGSMEFISDCLVVGRPIRALTFVDDYTNEECRKIETMPKRQLARESG